MGCLACGMNTVLCMMNKLKQCCVLFVVVQRKGTGAGGLDGGADVDVDQAQDKRRWQTTRISGRA